MVATIFSSSATVAEFTKINALPDAHIHPSVGDGDGQFCSYNGRFGMRRHIVVTLAGMFVVRLTLLDKVVEDSFHICLYIRIGVLVDG